jgi:hypothetical protein
METGVNFLTSLIDVSHKEIMAMVYACLDKTEARTDTIQEPREAESMAYLEEMEAVMET